MLVCIILWLLIVVSFTLLRIVFLAISAGSLLLNVQLRGFLDNIISAALDVNGWVVWLSILLDLVPLLGSYCDFTLGFLLGDFSAGSTASPVP